MIIIDKKLQEREVAGKPIQVGLIGAGEMAIGMVNQIERHILGMRIAGIYNRTVSKVYEAYKTAGHEEVVTAGSANVVDDAILKGQAVAAESLDVLLEAEGIDVIVEMTGSVEYAFSCIMKAFSCGKHVVSFNAELDATVGPYLQQQATKAGVRYTLGDGDQPGVTMNLFRYVKGMGFTPLVCGNNKGMLDHYRNPDTQKGFAEQTGMSVDMVTSFADGTKVSLEQASTANATGMQVARRGMIAIESDSHVDTMTDRYDVDQLRELGGVVEMIVGAQPGPGVFVYATTEDPVSARLLSYGKLGDGPLYSFYIPYHLLFLEFPFSIARLVDFGDGTLDALDRLSVEVVTTAKADLPAGTILDGIGGFAAYGECENHSVVQSDGLIPVAFSKGKQLVKDVKKDDVIHWSDVKATAASEVEQAYRSMV